MTRDPRSPQNSRDKLTPSLQGLFSAIAKRIQTFRHNRTPEVQKIVRRRNKWNGKPGHKRPHAWFARNYQPPVPSHLTVRKAGRVFKLETGGKVVKPERARAAVNRHLANERHQKIQARRQGNTRFTRKELSELL